jgi:hypothetical protein
MGRVRNTKKNTFGNVKYGKTNLWANNLVKDAQVEEKRKNKDIQNKSNALNIITHTLGNTPGVERTLRPLAYLNLDHTARSLVNKHRDRALAQRVEKRKQQEYDAQLRRESDDRRADENDEFMYNLANVEGTAFVDDFGDMPGDPPLHRSTSSKSVGGRKTRGRKTRGRKTRRQTRGRKIRGRQTRGR